MSYEEIYRQSFNDELEKIAGDDFLSSAAGSAIGTTAGLGAAGYGAYKAAPHLARKFGPQIQKKVSRSITRGLGKGALGLGAAGLAGYGAYKGLGSKPSRKFARGVAADVAGAVKSRGNRGVAKNIISLMKKFK